MVADNDTDKLRSIGLSVIALGVVLTGLVLGSSLLIPLAIAILLWNLLEALIDGVGARPLPPAALVCGDPGARRRQFRALHDSRHPPRPG